MMLITLDESMRNRLADYVDRVIASVCSYGNEPEIKRLHIELQKKVMSLQLLKNIGARLINILFNKNSFIQKTHFIDTNTLAQTTYYKTLTSRP